MNDEGIEKARERPRGRHQEHYRLATHAIRQRSVDQRGEDGRELAQQRRSQTQQRGLGLHNVPGLHPARLVPRHPLVEEVRAHAEVERTRVVGMLVQHLPPEPVEGVLLGHGERHEDAEHVEEEDWLRCEDLGAPESELGRSGVERGRPGLAHTSSLSFCHNRRSTDGTFCDGALPNRHGWPPGSTLSYC